MRCEAAGGLDDVAAVSVGAQQHGMVCLDDSGAVVRPALLWNDTRSDRAAADLVAQLGAEAWARAVGSVPVASFTVTKLRWLAEHEPAHADRTAAVCLPHDWLTWRLAGSVDPTAVTTDRGDASGTGYWSAATGEYRTDLLDLAFGRVPHLPTVLGPRAPAGLTPAGVRLGPGTGDNAAAALGLGAQVGDVIVSIGTSGTVFSVATAATADATGAVAGFADATGNFLPLVCTLNAARVLDVAAAMLGVDHDELSSAGAVGFTGRRRSGPRALSRGRADTEPAPRHRCVAWYAAGQLHPRPPGPGRRRRHALRAGRRARRPRRPRRATAAGGARRRRRSVGRGSGNRPDRFRRAGRSCRGRASGSPTGPHGRPPGSRWKPTASTVEAYRGTRTYEAEPEPLVRDKYANARELVTERAAD